MSRVTEKVMPGSMGGGWKRAGRPGSRRWAPASETPGLSAATYRRSAPRQPPTLLRTGNAADKFRQIDRYVEWRLRRFLMKRHGRNLHAGRADRWTEHWFHELGLYRLRGTIRYPEAA